MFINNNLFIHTSNHLYIPPIPIQTQIGFVWSVNDHIWDTNYEELRQFHAQHGNFNPTHKQNRKLAQFSARLRTAFSHKENGLVQQECKFMFRVVVCLEPLMFV